jgi:acyl-CoA thioester hydrolase
VDYVAWRPVTTRWRDDDAYGHLNNATYYELFDTAVNAHLYEATGLDIRALSEIGIVAETSCRYFRALRFPAPIDTGLVVDRVGASSVVYRIGLFQGASDEAAAEGRFVHVYVDNTRSDRPVVPVPAQIRAAVEPLVRV